jgi:hypothetical protein
MHMSLQVRLSIECERAHGAAGTNNITSSSAAAVTADVAGASSSQQQSTSTTAAEAAGTGSLPAAGGIDINELSWQDRERVLRLLFAKLNGRAAEQQPLVLGQHPLDVLTSAVSGSSGGDAAVQSSSGSSAGSLQQREQKQQLLQPHKQLQRDITSAAPPGGSVT